MIKLIFSKENPLRIENGVPKGDHIIVEGKNPVVLLASNLKLVKNYHYSYAVSEQDFARKEYYLTNFTAMIIDGMLSALEREGYETYVKSLAEIPPEMYYLILSTAPEISSENQSQLMGTLFDFENLNLQYDGL